MAVGFSMVFWTLGLSKQTMHLIRVLLPLWPGSHLNVSCPVPLERRWPQDRDAQRDWNQAPMKPKKAINMGP